MPAWSPTWRIVSSETQHPLTGAHHRVQVQKPPLQIPNSESVMQSLTIQQQQLQQQQQQQSQSLQLPLTNCGLTSGQFILPSPTAASTAPANQSTTTFQTFPAVVPAGQMQLLPVWLSNGETVYILANAQQPPSVVPGSNVLSSFVTSVLSIQPLQRPDILATVDLNPPGVSPLSTPLSWSDSSLFSTSGQSSDSAEFTHFVKRETGEPKNLFESKIDACANELPVNNNEQMLDCNNNGDVNACLSPAWRPW